MNTTTLNTATVGRNEKENMFCQISEFVRENWNTLFVGARRLEFENLVEKDYTAEYDDEGNRLIRRLDVLYEDSYTCERIQINSTRLHENIGLKYADGWKYVRGENIETGVTEVSLKNTIQEINILLEAAKKEIDCSFKLTIS